MAGVLHGTTSFPGVLSVQSCTYTVSHGISPGVAILVTNPQPNPPAAFGDLVFSDGNETVVIPGCRVDDLTIETNEQGTTWTLTIVDRRWRWRDLGGISGTYNQFDPNGKLIPWTIRSPTELAILCLQSLGETNYVINLPPGLPASAGLGVGVFLPTGIVYPPTGTNPPINWVGAPPAQALQQLADSYGCHVIYQLGNDGVLITPIGDGDLLPTGSIAREGPKLKTPETPDAVAVIGSPTRYQMRLALQPYGEEWDGSYVPINLLSYAPKYAAKVQISQGFVTYDGVTVGVRFQVFLAGKPDADPVVANAVLFEYVTVGGETRDVIVGKLAAAINASVDQRIQNKIAATTPGAMGSKTLLLKGLQAGFGFACATRINPNPGIPLGNRFVSKLIQTPQAGGVSWRYCYPPTFTGVRATDRLNLLQAQSLAQKSVWRVYRLSGVDVSGPGLPIVPGYGRVQRLQQIYLTDSQVDQIVPAVGQEGVGQKPLDLVQFIVNFYRSYSRDKPAAVYGAVNQTNNANNGIFNRLAGVNTNPEDQVLVPFSVDPVYQQIIFSDYVNFLDGAGLAAPTLQLQTAVNVRNPFTNAFEAYTEVRPLPLQNAATNPKVNVYLDIQLNITSTYSQPLQLDAQGDQLPLQVKSVSILEADPIIRANYYLNGMAAQYNLSAGLTRTYNGIRGINLDGAISQVTWCVGSRGAETTASRNTEHNVVVPTYPTRRRAESLPAVLADQAKLQNIQMWGNPKGLLQ